MKRIATPFDIILLLVSLLSAFGLDARQLTSAYLSEQLNVYIGTSSSEKIYLHIDRDRYIAGEDIWFSIYTTDGETGKLSARSAIAYIELLNPWNMPVIQERFKLSGGKGEGNFPLPDSISSGTYTIRAYTYWMKNLLPDYCFTYDVEIYNPFKGTDFWWKTGPADSSDMKLITSPDKGWSTVSLKVDTIFERREKVTLKIGPDKNNTDEAGISEMSISVTPAEVSADFTWTNDYSFPEAEPKQYRFESEGHYLSVKVKYSEDNVSDSSDFLYMSIQGKVADFNYAVRDTEGRYTFILPIDNKSRNLILQPEHANNNMILEIEPSFSWILPSSHSFKETFTDSQIDLFSELSFNYQAEKIYGTILKKEAETVDNSNLKKRRFYGIPELEIFLDDYIKLPSMQEVFFELLPGVNLRSRKSEYEIKITNPLTGEFYEEPPLVMIDGVIINNLIVLVDLNPELVEKVEVVKTPYLIGDLILHGIVNVITRSGDFSNINMPEYAVILPYRVVEKASTFISPDYSDKQQKLSRKPDLRNTLYWNPSVKTNMNGEALVEFWTSDLPGLYTINIQGISDNGKKIWVNKSFLIR
jgi:hypothetical protein